MTLPSQSLGFLGRGALGLLIGALALRVFALSTAPPPTPAELEGLRAAYVESEAPGGPSSLTVTVLRVGRPILTAFAAADEAPMLAEVDPGPILSRARILVLVLGSLATVLLALAVAGSAGRVAGWTAGGLFAVIAVSLDRTTLTEPASWLLVTATISIAGLARLARRGDDRTALVTGLSTGLAISAGGGAAGLLVGIPVALRGASASRLPVGIVPGAGALLGYALGAWGSLAQRTLPRIAEPIPEPVTSPLLEGLRLVGGAVGPVPAMLVLVAILVGLRSRDQESDPPRAMRAVAAATGGAFVWTLLWEGPDAGALAVVLPGLLVLAGGGAGRAAEILGSRAPARVGQIVALGAAFVVLVGTGGFLLVRGAKTPQEKASEWIRGNVPGGSVLLVEDPDVRVPDMAELLRLRTLVRQGALREERLFEYAPGLQAYYTVEQPAAGTEGPEGTLFYDPNLGRYFSWIVLRDLPAEVSESPEEWAAVRRAYHDYFTEAYDVGVRFEPGISAGPGVTILRRPTPFSMDRTRIGSMIGPLAGPALSVVRDSSSAFTDWVTRTGHAHLQAGEFSGARGLLDLAIFRDSTVVEPQYDLGLLHLLRDRDQQAKEAFLRVLSIDAYHGDAHFNLGMLLHNEGDSDGAEVEYRAAIPNMADPTPAMARLGALLAGNEDTDGAYEMLQSIRQLDPGGEADSFLTHYLGGS